MSQTLNSLNRQYDLWKLVDCRILETWDSKREHLICDIDKTYLETNFESLLKLAKIPFEKAHEKITVTGAREFLQAFRQYSFDAPHAERPIHFVSSSPPQLRRVLSRKLRMDGLLWSSDTFKDQVYNIRKGRFHLLKSQMAYKSAAILNVLNLSRPETVFHMIGDNAESDAFIYLGVKLFVEKRLTRMAYLKYLDILKVDKKLSLQLLRHLKLGPFRIGLIMIRKLPSYDFPLHPPLTDPVVPFDSYWQAFKLFHENKIVSSSFLEPMTYLFCQNYGMKEEDLRGVRPLTLSSLNNFERLTEQEILDLLREWCSKRV
ncbi:MAG: hypothetical protein HYW48_02135 [Deltaproteobacteria bacterium]|nr:hypothetical protein [Deltaproteobacteria bacterium]